MQWVTGVCVVAACLVPALAVEKITASVSVVRGPVNGVLITRNGETLAVYGDPRPQPALAKIVVFTHQRRDVAWAGRQMMARGAAGVAPEAERDLFTNVGAFWDQYRRKRFHDYANQ